MPEHRDVVMSSASGTVTARLQRNPLGIALSVRGKDCPDSVPENFVKLDANQIGGLHEFCYAVRTGQKHVAAPVLDWHFFDGNKRHCTLECRPAHPYKPMIRVSELQPGIGKILLIAQWPGKADYEVVFSVEVRLRENGEPCSLCDGKRTLGDPEKCLERCYWCHGHGRSVMDEAKDIATALYGSWIRSPGEGGDYVKGG